MRFVIAFAVLLSMAGVPSHAQDASAKPDRKAVKPAPLTKEQLRLEALKKDAIADVDGMATLTQQMVDSVFSFAELGFQEVESSRYLTGVLELAPW